MTGLLLGELTAWTCKTDPYWEWDNPSGEWAYILSLGPGRSWWVR